MQALSPIIDFAEAVDSQTESSSAISPEEKTVVQTNDFSGFLVRIHEATRTAQNIHGRPMPFAPPVTTTTILKSIPFLRLIELRLR